MISQAESAAAEAGTGYGFRVSIRSKSLSSGQFRVKLSTVKSVFGAGLVPSVGGLPVDVTLVDDSDSSSWPVRLTATADEQCSISGLQQWLKHRGASAGEKLQVDRRAGPAYFVSLVHNAAAVPVANDARGIFEQRAPAGADSQPDRVPCNRATRVAVAAVPVDPPKDAAGGSGAGPRLGGRGWERVNALPAQPADGFVLVQPAIGPQHRQPGAPNSDTAVVQVKVDPEAGVGGQQARQQGGGEAQARGQEPGSTSEQRPPRGLRVQQQQPVVHGATVEGAVAAQRVAVKQEPDACK